MGTVWLAERSDGRFQRRVAIKFLNFAVAQTGAERFKREGQILGRLVHPHIAQMIDAGVTPAGQPYLVLEYCEGEQLELRRLSTQVFDLDNSIRTLPGSTEARERLVSIALQYLDGLAANAHGDLDLAEDLGEGYWQVARTGCKTPFPPA